MSLTTTASSRLRSSLSRRVVDAPLAVLGREADQHLAGAASPARRAEHVAVGSSSSSGAPAVLLELVIGRVPGRKSATAAAISNTSVASNSRSQASALSSAAVCDRHDLRRGGRRQRDVGGDQRDLGAAARGLLRRARSPSGPRSGCR